jgi:hypothetical protein
MKAAGDGSAPRGGPPGSMSGQVREPPQRWGILEVTGLEIGFDFTKRNDVTMRSLHLLIAAGLIVYAVADLSAQTGALTQPPNTWVKRSPLADTPVSPRLGYEGACVWDGKHRVIIRYGGHNQGGGGEQGAEVWIYDPMTAKWTLKETNLSPPGVCCDAQNVFDTAHQRYVRFPSFSGSHGWQWWREIYLNDSSVWTYDLETNTWRNMRPLPAPHVAPLRCATWDSDEQVALVFGGEGGPKETLAYDPHRNEWRWLKPPFQPEPRSGGQMAYDSAHKVHVLFGSQFNDDPHTWLYDFRKNEWRDAKPSAMPPTDKNDAVLTYDPFRQAVLAITKATTGEEESAKHTLTSWAYDAGANVWTKLNPAQEPDPSGNRARQLIFAPELDLALLENCPSKPREQQVWTYRSGSSAKLPEPARPRKEPRVVEDGVASVISSKQVELTWKAGAPGVAGYHVERAVVEMYSEDQLRRLRDQTPPLDEPSAGAIHRIGAFTRLTTSPLKATEFTDNSIDLSKQLEVTGEPVFDRNLHLDHLYLSGKPYRFAVFAYRVRAIDASGAESGPSPPFFTLPSPPQSLFSREDGSACHLKWAANPEKALKGYRVYRMDGRYDKDRIPRLTAEPVSATTFADPNAGKSTRRYYVVAVDALGQEGFPTSPVWYEREWKQYYKPFTGEWHQ